MDFPPLSVRVVRRGAAMTKAVVAGFETARLVLRTWRVDDRAEFRRINADPEVMRHFRKALDARESDGFTDRIEADFAHPLSPHVLYGMSAAEYFAGESLPKADG